MALFTNKIELACTAAEAFDFLRTTANRMQLAPPEAALQLVEGPALLEVGSRSTWKLRRFGLSQTVVLEVTVCDPPTRLVEEQRQGPLRRWEHTITCNAQSGGTLVKDVIDFDPPGGLLGLLATAGKIHEKLTESFAWRDRRLREMLESRDD